MTTPNHAQVAWKTIPALVRSCPLTRDSGSTKRTRNSEWFIAALFSGSRWPHPLPMPPSPNLRKKKRKWEVCSVAGDDCWHSTHSFSTHKDKRKSQFTSPLLSQPKKGEMHFCRGAHRVPHWFVLQVLLPLPQSRTEQRLIHPPLLVGMALPDPGNSHFQLSHGGLRAGNPWMQQWQREEGKSSKMVKSHLWDSGSTPCTRSARF